MGDAADPFVVVREEVEVSVKNASALYTRWMELYESPSCDSEEFEWTTNELRTSLKSIEWDLEDLEETISIVEQSPGRFKISADEMAARKRFIANTRQTVKKYRTDTTGKKARGKVAERERAALINAPAASRYAKLDQAIDDANSEFIDGESQRQEMIVREQDKQLSEVGQTIGVLKQMGEMIGDELDDQNELLDAFDDEMEHTQSSLQRTVTRLDKALAISRDGKQSCCICLLVLTVLILIIVYVTK